MTPIYLSDDATQEELIETAEEARLNREQEALRKRLLMLLAQRADDDSD